MSGHLETVGHAIDFMHGRVPQVAEYYVEEYHQQRVV